MNKSNKKIEPIKIRYSEPPKGYVGLYQKLPLPLDIYEMIEKLNEVILRLNELTEKKC